MMFVRFKPNDESRSYAAVDNGRIVLHGKHHVVADPLKVPMWAVRLAFHLRKVLVGREISRQRVDLCDGLLRQHVHPLTFSCMA